MSIWNIVSNLIARITGTAASTIIQQKMMQNQQQMYNNPNMDPNYNQNMNPNYYQNANPNNMGGDQGGSGQGNADAGAASGVGGQAKPGKQA